MAKKLPNNQTKQLQTEIKRLTLENEKLKAQNADEKHQHFSGWSILRRTTAILLTAFGVALVVAGNLLFWMGNTLVKTDRYVATTAPIIKDTEVQKALALYTTNQIFANVDVQAITEQALPEKAQFLAPQLTAQLKTQTENLLQNALANPKLQDAWNNAQAQAHERLVTFAANYEGSGTITLNNFYEKVTASLSDTKLSFLADKSLPPDIGSITIVNATWLPTFHNIVTKIDTWRVLAILLLVLCVGLAVWLSKKRQTVIYTFGIATSVMMLMTLVSIRFTREAIASRADPQYEEGVRHAAQIILHPLVVQTSVIFFAGLLLVFIVWVSSQAKSALKFKDQIARLLTGRLHETMLGKSSGKFVSWVQHYRRIIEWSIVGVLSLIMLLVRLTPKSLILYSVLLLILILVVEIIGFQKNPGRQ